MIRFALAALAALLVLGADPLAGQASCPPDAAGSRVRVDGYLTHANFAAHRDSLGIEALGPADVRLLTDAADLPACDWLVSTFGAHGSHPNWYWSAYHVGSYYVVAWRYVNTDGGYRIGLIPMLIFDSQFRQVGGFAS